MTTESDIEELKNAHVLITEKGDVFSYEGDLLIAKDMVRQITGAERVLWVVGYFTPEFIMKEFRIKKLN